MNIENPNPYNCTAPGNLFVGYEYLVLDILKGFKNGNSFAILGGRRCGKTSILLKLQKKLVEEDSSVLAPFNALPHYLDIQGLSRVSLGFLFRKIYELITEDIQAEPWPDDGANDAYQVFLRQMENTQGHFVEKYGPDYLIVLLIDELDSAITSLPDDQFFQNLRNLLMVSSLHRHFRLVATGVKELAGLISSGSSPLNNLRHKYLGILTEEQARQLILAGFPNCLNPDEEELLLNYTGRHPYLLQGVLEKVWENNPNIDINAIKQATKQFLIEHNDFRRWVESFSDVEHAVYSSLVNNKDDKLTFEKIHQNIEPSLNLKLDDAILVLSYHGVVDDTDPDRLRLTSKMFRDWYVNNCVGVPNLSSKRKNGDKNMKKTPVKPTKAKVSSKTKDKRDIQIFMSYASENNRRVRKIFEKLRRRGFQLWLDQENLKGGVEWRYTIEKALEESTLAILFLSKRYVTKTGFVQKETVKILDMVDYQPQGRVFLIPVRLESCEYPDRLKRFQIVDYYKKDGYAKLIEAIESALG